jgi:hypothetical protein
MLWHFSKFFSKKIYHHMKHPTAKVLLSPFEKAAIAAIDYLCENWPMHKRFRHKSELLQELGLRSNNYGAAQKHQRNIPPEYWRKISDVLVNRYNVHPTFLHTNKGEMFLNANWLQEPEPVYGIDDLRSDNTRLKNENSRLKKENKDLKAKNELLEELVAQMKRKK